jgi:hypothetical protein
VLHAQGAEELELVVQQRCIAGGEHPAAPASLSATVVAPHTGAASTITESSSSPRSRSGSATQPRSADSHAPIGRATRTEELPLAEQVEQPAAAAQLDAPLRTTNADSEVASGLAMIVDPAGWNSRCAAIATRAALSSSSVSKGGWRRRNSATSRT